MARTIIMLCGLPRSGKTTLRKAIIAEDNSYTVISADDLRLLVYGQTYYAKGEASVWSKRATILEYLMGQEKDLIIDETNTTVARRKGLIKLSKEYQYKLVICYINTKLKTCIERANSDLALVIKSMNEKFEEPTYKEAIVLTGSSKSVYKKLANAGWVNEIKDCKYDEYFG